MIKDMSIVILLLLSTLFAISYAITFKKLTRVVEDSAKLLVDNIALSNLVNSKLETNKADEEVHKENFLKFLSDSRDWAFEYIEDVQSGLIKFVDDIKPEIDYFKEYGDVVSMQPNYYSMKKISEAYDELVKLLPKDDSV
jgi:hypothetical protein